MIGSGAAGILFREIIPLASSDQRIGAGWAVAGAAVVATAMSSEIQGVFTLVSIGLWNVVYRETPLTTASARM